MENDDLEKSILPVKIDLTKTGLESCFKPYQVLMHKYAWGALSEEEPMGSGKLWLKVNELLPDGETKSRASIIFAANDYVEMGIWAFKDRTGKGGHHRLYYPVITQAEFWERLADSVKQLINFSAGKKIL